MPDDDFDRLGRQLRAGAARIADDLTPRPAGLIRARGDQRRRRKFAGSLALALVVIAGGGGTAYAIGQHGPTQPRPVAPATATPSATPAHPATPPASTISGATNSPGGTTSPGTTATTRTLQLGPLTLRVPGTWRITARDAQGDYTVSTGSCPGEAFLAAQSGSACPSFLLIRNAGPTPGIGGFSMQTYMPGQFWTTSTGATGCPGKPSTSTTWLRSTPIGPLSSGYAPVTAGKTADYTVWRFGCYGATHAPPAFYFEQRDWYLPVSRILIVDEYATPGLAQILATATWAG